MHPSLNKLFNEIEAQRKRTLEALRPFTAEELNRAIPGKWTVTQILGHLLTAERLSLMYMQKKFLGIQETRDSGLWEEVKMVVLKISQRTPGLKFKAPKKVVEYTTSYYELAAISTDWDKIREELRSLLEKIPQDQINRKIYRHVRAGYLNISHALMFFREHIIHHTPQIKKLVNLK